MNSSFPLDTRTRDETTLIDKCVWRDRQSLTNVYLSIARCFCDEGLNAIRCLWHEQNGLCCVLDNSNECHSGMRGGTVINKLQSEPGRQVTACTRTGIVTRETSLEVCPIDVANNEVSLEVCPKLDVINRESVVKVCPKLDVIDRESVVNVCPKLDVVVRESVVKVCPKLDVVVRESVEKVCPKLDVIDRESVVKVFLQSPAENWASGVKMCLQSDPDNKEPRMTACYSRMKDIDRPQKTTPATQDDKVNAWRKGGCLCQVQQLYERRSRLQANSRISTRKRHIALAACRHVKFARKRRRQVAAATENRNTRLSQSAGLSLRDQLRMKRSSTIERLVPRCVHQLKRSERLQCYFLNVNTNAGIMDGPEKTETKQASCTSVHSSDQYFSTHTDTPDGRVLDSDNEVSPSFSFTEDAAEKLATSPHSDPDPVLSKSCDQMITLRHLDNKDKRTELVEMRDRGQRKNGGGASSDENVDLKAGKCCRANQGATSLLQDDHQSNKHKKKSKTTETVYIKFESSMSKKVTTTTTVLKDAKRPGTNKSKSDTHKQLLHSEDVQKAIASVPEKLDNRVLVDTPRYTKIVRCPEGRQGSPDQLVKCSDDIITVDESAPKRTGQNVARTAESDDHLYHFKTPPLAACTSGNLGKASSLSERTTSQKSPSKSRSPHSHLETKVDVFDSDYASERESSAATIVNVPKVSPRPKVASIKEGKEQIIRNENISKVDKTKQFDSNLKEVKHIQEKRDQPKHISPTKESGCTRLDKEEQDHSQTAALHMSKAQSPKVDSLQFTATESSSRKRNTTKQKGDSPQKKSSIDIIAKHDSKKVVAFKARSRTTDDLSTKEDTCDHSKRKAGQQALTCSRKRSPARTKTQSRSPDAKRRKRSAKKSADTKGSKSPEHLKSDKSKKVKSADKTVDKKKKKKKQKQKSAGKSEADNSDKLSSTKKVAVSTRSRSSESSKAPQMLTSFTSAPHSAEVGSMIQLMSPGNLWNGDDSKLPQQGDKVSGGVDRDSSSKPREMKTKNRAASSAENVSMSEGTTKPIRAAESVPTFTGTVYTSITKVVQVASCPKTRKSEKDLQQAELGWNSSTLSAEEKAAAERIKQNQRKVKARYYLMKTKTRSGEYEPARIRRTIARRNQADGDNGAREIRDRSVEMRGISDKSDASQAEKTKLGQGKSVQFSESTEDHEASRDETEDGYSAFQDSHESDTAGHKYTIVLQPSGKSVVLTQPLNKLMAVSLATGKTSVEIPKPMNKSDVDGPPVANKPTIQKKEEPRSQTTPPRKRRPIWQKKAAKEKAPSNTKAQTAAVKSVPALAPIKQRQSSDNILKPAARPNLGFLYPGKPKIQSPSFSNISLDDKRTVAYNTWINSNIPAAPMNKATRKLVAQTGSPVDIKEIIEGSSVDAADYHRSMRALHELGFRATKSVPPLGARRSTSTDVVGSKRMKLLSACHRKNKVHESSSARSLSSMDGAEEQGLTSKYRSSGRDVSVSPDSSTDVDNGPMFKCRTGPNRFADQMYPRKKKEKHGKKFAKDGTGKWRLVHAQDVHSVPDLTRVQYCGDATDLNTLNMGLSWVVQSVFSRLPFLSQRPASSNASGDMSVGHLGQ